MKSHRLAIVSTHPIQYHSAWFRRMASESRLNIDVFYCHNASAKEQADAGFGVTFEWDVSLLDGYRYRFLKNVSQRPGIAHFQGVDTPEIVDIIKRERFDAVMVNGWHYKSAWQTMRACWRTKTPVMVRSDSHLHDQRSIAKRILKRPFYSWFISKLDACLPVGKWSSDYFLHYGANAERIFVVPHVVDTDYFQNESQKLRPERKVLRSELALDEAAVVLLFVGKFIERKRPLDFVVAIEQARSIGANVQGLMVGDGPLRACCEDVVRQKNLPIKFAGFLNQSQIVKAYVVADALVLTSDQETWGLVVNEAMACGVPCFVSDIVGCGPDLIVANETGSLFALGDTGTLATLLSSFAAEKKRIEWMSKRAREKAQQYTLNVAVERTCSAVEAVSA